MKFLTFCAQCKQVPFRPHIAKADGRKVVADVNMPLLRHSSHSRRRAVRCPNCCCTALHANPQGIMYVRQRSFTSVPVRPREQDQSTARYVHANTP